MHIRSCKTTQTLHIGETGRAALEPIMARPIRPTASYFLDCRYLSLCYAGQVEQLFVQGHDRRIVVLNLKNSMEVLNSISDHGMYLYGVSPDGEKLVLNQHIPARFCVISAKDRQLYEESSNLAACRFTSDGSMCWVIVYVDDDNFEVQLRDAKTWQTLRSASCPVPQIGPNYYLPWHPDDHIAPIWAAAGQDGQWIYWAWDDGEELCIVCSDVFENDGLHPPVFRPDGREFLTIGDYVIYRCRFPSSEWEDYYLWELSDPDAEEDQDWPSDVVYASDESALLVSSWGRVYELDLSKMKLGEELFVEGHPPRPSRELYPDLEEGASDIISDLHDVQLLGGQYAISRHKRLPAVSPRDEDWKDELFLWGEPYSCGPFRAADTIDLKELDVLLSTNN